MRAGCCVDKDCAPTTCMRLPEGESCGTCAHFARCQMLFRSKPDDEQCDFFPRKFRRTPSPPRQADDE